MEGKGDAVLCMGAHFLRYKTVLPRKDADIIYYFLAHLVTA